MEQSSHNHPTPAARHWYLDFLRILSTFGVIVLHMTPFVSLDVPVSSAAWKVMHALSTPFRASVALFFMISGALFLDPARADSTKKLFRKTLPRMLVSFFFWSAVYAAAHCLLYGKGKWTFLNQLFRGHYHMWYILTIISLYLITPILRQITRDQKTTRYLLVAGFALTFACARVLGFVQLFALPHADVAASVQSFYLQVNPYKGLYFVLYFVLGHYLHAYPPKKSIRRLAGPLFLCGVLATGILGAWHSQLLGETSSYFSDLASLNILAMAVGLFVLMQDLCLGFAPSERTGRRIQLLSRDTYGIYLVHAFIIERLALPFSAQPISLFAMILLGSCAVFILSLLVSAVLNRVPVLKKYIV